MNLRLIGDWRGVFWQTLSTNRLLNAPLRVAGAQDIMARSGIVRMIRRIALPGNGPSLAVRGLRDGDVIVVVDQGVPFPQPPKPFENLVVFLRAARLAQPFVQVSKIGFEAFTLLRQNGLILFLTGLAPDAQLRLVLMVMRQSPGPHLMPRSGVNRCIGIPCVHTVRLIRFDPAPLDGDTVITPFAQLGEIVLGGDAGVHNDRRLVLALILCGKAVQRFEKRAGFADIARQNTGPARKTARIRSKSQRDQGTIVPLPLGTSEPGQPGCRSSGHVRVGQIIEDHRAGSAEQLALAGKQGVFDGPVVFDQDIAEAIELVQFEHLPGIEAQELERGAVGLQPVRGCLFTGRVALTQVQNF